MTDTTACRVCGRPVQVHDVVCERKACGPHGWPAHVSRRLGAERSVLVRILRRIARELRALDAWLGGSL